MVCIFVDPRLPISSNWMMNTDYSYLVVWSGISSQAVAQSLCGVFKRSFFPTHRQCNSQPSLFCDVGIVCLGPYMDVCWTNTLNQQKHFLEAWKLQHVDNRLSFSFCVENHTRICFCWKKQRAQNDVGIPYGWLKCPCRDHQEHFWKKQQSVLLHSGNISFLASGGLPREPLTTYTGNKYSSLEQRQHMS